LEQNSFVNYQQTDTLQDIIEKPKWVMKEQSGNYTFTPYKTFIPDCIKVKNNSFYIYDAKYYAPKFINKRILNQPGISDISKQFIYELVYKDFINEYNLNEVRNYFLIPWEGNFNKELYVEMQIFNDIGLSNIEVKLVDVNHV